MIGENIKSIITQWFYNDFILFPFTVLGIFPGTWLNLWKPKYLKNYQCLMFCKSNSK